MATAHTSCIVTLAAMLIAGCWNEIQPCPRTYVRGAPPVASSEPDSFKDNIAAELYELGKKTARLEAELLEASKVLYFIHCVSRTTGRDFVVDDLQTAAAKRCRIEVNEAAERPDFLERVDEIDKHASWAKCHD